MNKDTRITIKMDYLQLLHTRHAYLTSIIELRKQLIQDIETNEGRNAKEINQKICVYEELKQMLDYYYALNKPNYRPNNS